MERLETASLHSKAVLNIQQEITRQKTAKSSIYHSRLIGLEFPNEIAEQNNSSNEQEGKSKLMYDVAWTNNGYTEWRARCFKQNGDL